MLALEELGAKVVEKTVPEFRGGDEVAGREGEGHARDETLHYIKYHRPDTPAKNSEKGCRFLESSL